jgi:hypothetical protein
LFFTFASRNRSFSVETFKDKDGREWQLDFTFGSLSRLKKASAGKYDLIDNAAELAHKLWSDLGEFFECLCHLVDPQVKAAGIDGEQFGNAIAADCIIEAREKFFAEWKDFFRKLQRDEAVDALEKILTLNRRAAEAMRKKARALMTREFDEKAAKKIDEAVTLAFGQLQEFLESTPALAPGESSN